MKVASFLALLLLAGCLDEPQPATVTPTIAAAPPPVVTVTFKVVDPDGNPMAGAEIYAVPKAEVSQDPRKLPMGRATDQRGEARLVFASATDLVVQAFGPGKGQGWTREGMRVSVGDDIKADRDVPILNRTLTLTLFRSEQEFTRAVSWQDAKATLRPDGSVEPALLRVPVPLDARYAARLSAVEAKLAWNNTATSYGDLFAGILYSGAETRGTDKLQLPGPSNPVESVDASMNPTADGTLEVTAYTSRAIVGRLDLVWSGTLHFGGFYPEELPAPACLADYGCALPALPT